MSCEITDDCVETFQGLPYTIPECGGSVLDAVDDATITVDRKPKGATDEKFISDGRRMIH